MPPYLTPLQIFENYKKTNPQKCKGKSTTEICKLAGLNDNQITELKNTSAWLFCFDKETANTNQDFSMTQILGGNFKKTQVKSGQKNNHTIDIKKVVNDVINFKNRTNKLTTNISTLESIINTNINQENIVEFLELYKRENGQSFFDLISGYKLVDNDKRMEVTLNIFNKLISHIKSQKGKEVELINKLGTEEIKYQFDKTGFIENDNVNAFFDALIIIAKRKTSSHLKAGKNDKFVDDFKIPTYISKKESISKFKSTNTGKVVKYSLPNGNTVEEIYYFDAERKKLVMESRKWQDKAGNDIKFVKYYNGNENSIQSVHFFKNGVQAETHFYRQNGMESMTILSKDENVRIIIYSENGIAVEDKLIKNPDNKGKYNKITNSYNINGQYNKGPLSTDAFRKKSKREQLAMFYSMLPEESDFRHFYKKAIPNILEKYDKRIQKNIMLILFENCEKHSANSHANIDSLKNQAVEYIQNGEIIKAWSLYMQAFKRSTVMLNRRYKEGQNRDIPINGKVDHDFKQGNFGTCWLTSAIKSLTLNPEGQKILDEVVKKDTKTGNIIVTLKGAPLGQQVYIYTQKQIVEASELSVGDGDVRAIEMAFRDLFMKNDATYGNKAQNSIEGNGLKLAFNTITGNEATTYASYDFKQKCLPNAQDKLDKLIGKKNLVALCSFINDFKTKDDTKTSEIKKVEINKIHTQHAYSLKSVDKKYVYVINPWDTSETIKIARKDFERYCFNISILDI